MLVSLRKQNYWIRYRHNGVEDNEHGRYIVIQDVAVGRESEFYPTRGKQNYLIAFCRKSNVMKHFILDDILDGHFREKDSMALIKKMQFGKKVEY